LKALARVRRRLGMRPDRNEKGQALLEMTFGTIFLSLIVLIVFEMAMLFYSYIAVLNAAREGAWYAALNPDMTPGSAKYDEYLEVTTAEAVASGLVTATGYFTITVPVDCTVDDRPGMLTTVHYKIVNPTHGIVLPWLGRMGLFQSAIMSGRDCAPIPGSGAE